MNTDTADYTPGSKSSELTPGNSPSAIDIERKLLFFHQGNTNIFDSPGLVKVISQHIFDIYYKGDLKNALMLLENLGDAALSQKKEHRERSLIALSLIAEKVIQDANEDLLGTISKLLIRWLGKENEIVSGFEVICLQIGSLVELMLDFGLWSEAENLIIALQDIRKGQVKKSKVFSQVVSRIQSRIAKKKYLELLVQSYIDPADEKSEVAGTLLAHLGDKSAPFLIQKLALSKKKEERFRLLDLIPAGGSDIIPSLTSQLQDGQPWYFARNLIHIMSRLSDTSLYPYVKPYMDHSDIRVQHEVITYIKQINGNDTASRLLDAVNVCNDSLKPKLIQALGPIKERRIGNTFAGILKNYCIFTREYRNDIIQEVCRNLHYHQTERVFQALEYLNREKESDNHLTTETRRTIEQTYLSFKEKLPSASPDSISYVQSEGITTPENQSDNANRTPDPDSLKKSNTSSLPHGFSQLDDLGSIPSPLKNHILQLRSLYSKMNQSEFLAFTSLLTHKTYEANEKLSCMGDMDSTLFFIEGGEVKIDFAEAGDITLFRNLQKGDIFGHQIFMNGGEWSVSLTAMTETTAFIFDQEQLLSLQSQFPRLCQTILDYCRKNDVILNLHDSVAGKKFTAESNNLIPFSGSDGDLLSNVTVSSVHPSGFCFSLSLPHGIDYAVFADKELFIWLESQNGECRQINALVLGLKFSQSTRTLHVIAGFHTCIDPEAYICTEISL